MVVAAVAAVAAAAARERYNARMDRPDRRALVTAVQRALDDTEAEYAQLPFFVRPMVRRGFTSRTGHDLAAWRQLLAQAAAGAPPPGLAAALGALAEHYRGAPERARRGMGGSAEQLAEIERRSQARAAAAEALRAELAT